MTVTIELQGAPGTLTDAVISEALMAAADRIADGEGVFDGTISPFGQDVLYSVEIEE